MEIGAWVGRSHQYELYLIRPGIFTECRRSPDHSYANADYTGSSTI